MDLALSEEAVRCEESSVERIGLGMMEPRPVDPLPTVVDEGVDGESSASGMKEGNGKVDEDDEEERQTPRKPRYVMGGIFEVMEGTA